MLTTKTIEDVRREVGAARSRGERVGCVPTMGALHEGHLSLIRTARQESGWVVVTVFVNPAQFGPNEDFQAYPRPIEQDLETCRAAGVDLVFHPERETMYRPESVTVVEVEGLSEVWEGACRPGHFRGVATVVTKLFNIVAPDFAYFGRKDFQQQLLIRRMCEDLNIPVDVRTCPTMREADGLALSSRNAYLNPEERISARSLSQALFLARDRLQAGERDVAAVRDAMHGRLAESPGVSVDYATIADPHTLKELTEPQSEMVALVAATVGPTRLIDNLPIELNAD